jgi:hypothetical protein
MCTAFTRATSSGGTNRAIARDPRRAAPFFGITYMTARKADLTALYTALGVAHTDLAVADSSAIEQPPTQAQVSAALGMSSVQGSRAHFHRLAEGGYMKHVNRTWYAVVPAEPPVSTQPEA